MDFLLLQVVYVYYYLLEIRCFKREQVKNYIQYMYFLINNYRQLKYYNLKRYNEYKIM